MNRLLAAVLVFTGALPLFAQTSAFQFSSFAQPTSEYRELAVDREQLAGQLANSPKSFTGSEPRNFVSLPLPDGTFGKFYTTDRPVLPANLAAKYPAIQSFVVEGPWGGGRLSVTPQGIDALLSGPEGWFAIQPTEQNDRHEIFYSEDYAGEEITTLACGYVSEGKSSAGGVAGATPLTKAAGEPRDLYQYDLALASTGEFADRVGNTKAEVLSAFNVAVSTINAIFETEVGVTIRLIPETEDLIYLDPDTDIFQDANNGGKLLVQVIKAMQAANISSDQYDLGHLFTGSCEDVGGVVAGEACTARKSRGVSCQTTRDVARTAQRIMAHEIAHQFDVSHTWNNCPGSLEQRAGQTAFEPGAGNTIMSYAGTCGSQNVGSLIPFYHIASIEQFVDYTRQGAARGCATVIETENVSPEVTLNYPQSFFIPKSTPFVLVGTATDANNDLLTYSWEQYDRGPIADVRDPEGDAPLFVSLPPSTEGATRYFPRIDRVANGINSRDEYLPDYGRAMTFRLVVRDNNPQAGAVGWETVSFRTSQSVGPLLVDEPDFGDSTVWRVGEYREVSWDVAGTDGFPVFTDRVNIRLSTDGGITFDRLLASNVANNGSAFVTVPDVSGDAMRIIVEAVDNIYFNMNQADFSIRPAANPTFTLIPDVRYAQVCLPDVVEVNLASGALLGFSETIELQVIGEDLPEGLVTNLSTSQLEPGMAATLTIDLTEVKQTTRLVIPVSVSAAGMDTTIREIILDVTNNDFSALEPKTPQEGATGIILTTPFTWTPTPNADSYDLEIATSPSFAGATIFSSVTNLEDTTFTPTDFFPVNQLFFWRIRPENDCGKGAWTVPVSFRTVNTDCTSLLSTDTPIALPGSGRSYTRQSKLFVERRGTITDLNVPDVLVRYQFTSGITIKLISPGGTTVILYDQNCFSTNLITLGFDDESPLNITCPPDDEQVVRPIGDLADFDGEDTFGEWIMEVTVNQTNGSVGQFGNWTLEFCGESTALMPELVSNNATQVPELGRQRILRSALEVNSPGFTTNFTYYILTAAPAAGELFLEGRMLMPGDTFTQADINGQRLVYEHLDGDILMDSITYVVSTPDGGYLPGGSHSLIVSEDATTSTSTPGSSENGLTVFPNPTAGDIRVAWEVASRVPVTVELYDINGRQVSRIRVAANTAEVVVSTDGLPAGVYLLRANGAMRRVVKR